MFACRPWLFHEILNLNTLNMIMCIIKKTMMGSNEEFATFQRVHNAYKIKDAHKIWRKIKKLYHLFSSIEPSLVIVSRPVQKNHKSATLLSSEIFLNFLNFKWVKKTLVLWPMISNNQLSQVNACVAAARNSTISISIHVQIYRS